ncbi:MAG: FKBP-type peptidyl-prolyl cis-trans isomerase [Coriobacteriales bacterium]|jgi:foldase protein PrsA|nr:FKBP-type peptidyl-prolyl cis-trans isomerase [Coriobacteriales bacterium]
MKTKTKCVTGIMTIMLCAALATPLTGCGPADSVAATVNGVDIRESTITERIMAIRSGNASYNDNVVWANALVLSNLTPATLRERMIEAQIEQILIKEIAEERGMSVDASEIDATVQQAKRTIGGTDANWTSALKKQGYATEDDFRDMLEVNDLALKIYENMDIEPTADELVNYVLANASTYRGKRSSAIIIASSQSAVDPQGQSGGESSGTEASPEEGQPATTEEQPAQEEQPATTEEQPAQEEQPATTEEQPAQAPPASLAEETAAIMEKLNSGVSFESLVAEYSTDAASKEKSGDMGWGSNTSYDTTYQQVLDTLAVGQVSEPFVGTDGSTYIVKCTEEFYPPAEGEGTISYNDVPESIVDDVRTQWIEANRQAKFTELINARKEASEITINPMPNGLPYDVDMGIATASPTTDEEGNPTYATSQPDAVQSALGQGLLIEDKLEGTGAAAGPGSKVTVIYSGRLEDGTYFDNTGEPYTFILGGASVIKGWDAGLVGMKIGGIRILTIPPSLGYGSQDRGTIPPDSTLIFEIQLISIEGEEPAPADTPAVEGEGDGAQPEGEAPADEANIGETPAE